MTSSYRPVSQHHLDKISIFSFPIFEIILSISDRRHVLPSNGMRWDRWWTDELIHNKNYLHINNTLSAGLH